MYLKFEQANLEEHKRQLEIDSQVEAKVDAAEPGAELVFADNGHSDRKSSASADAWALAKGYSVVGTRSVSRTIEPPDVDQAAELQVGRYLAQLGLLRLWVYWVLHSSSS